MWSRRDLLKGGALAGGVVAAPGVVGGCGALGLGNTLERIESAGVVKLGFAGERPYSYRADGRLVGASVAVHRAVFGRIGGIEVQGVRVRFDELIEGLNAGTFDGVAAGMFVTANRCQRAAFSDPIYCAQEALLVRRGNPLGLSDYSSVAQSNATLAVLAGGVEDDYARAAGVTDAQLKQIGSQREGLRLVASGQADAFTLTSISLRALLGRASKQARRPEPPGARDEGDPVQQVQLLQPFMPVVDGTKQLDCGGAAFRTTDTDLRDAFNAGLAGLRRRGRVLDLMAPYGFTEAEMPPPGVSTQQLCRKGGVTGGELDPLPR